MQRVPPEMLMCKVHWFKVPAVIRERVWQTYRTGQCDDKNPSVEWMAAADAAIGFIAKLEGKSVLPSEAQAMEDFQ
jgi:hypothetical protein